MHNRKGPRPKPPEGCKWIEDAAAHLGVELSTLRKWRLRGKGPVGFKVGRYVTYKIADLDAYLDGQYRAATEPSTAAARDSRPPEPRHAPRHRTPAAA